MGHPIDRRNSPPGIVRSIGSVLVWIGLALIWLSSCHPRPTVRTSEAVAAVSATTATVTATGKGSGKARVRKANGDVIDLEWFDEWLAGQEVKATVKIDAAKKTEIDTGLPWWAKALSAIGAAAAIAGTTWIAVRLARR